MGKYYRGHTTTPLENHFPAVTDKAIAITVSGGYTNANDWIAWLPKSQIIIGEPNELGNAEILIPAWLLKKNGIEFERIREIEVCGVVERIGG